MIDLDLGGRFLLYISNRSEKDSRRQFLDKKKKTTLSESGFLLLSLFICIAIFVAVDAVFSLLFYEVKETGGHFNSEQPTVSPVNNGSFPK